MENRGIAYLFTILAGILVMVVIQKMLPHHEPPKPTDKIGMKLYRPLFFGTSDDKPAEVPEDVFQDTAPDEAEVLEEAPALKESKPTATTSTPTTDTGNYLEGLIADYKVTVLSKRRYRNDVVVRYYKHAPDGDKADVLVPFGFYLHVRTVNNPEHFENHTSNIIYFGKDFPESDLKLVAALLVNEGLPIKLLQPFKDYDGWKHKSIEIGSSTKLSNHPVLTMDDIRNFQKPE